MRYSRLWVSAAIIAIVIVVAFVLSVPHTRDIVEKAELAEEVVIPEVTIKDTYRKGVYTIRGSLEMPNACTTISATAALSGNASSTQSIRVDISMPKDMGVCLQVPTRAPFETSVTAPVGLIIDVFINGLSASTTEA